MTQIRPFPQTIACAALLTAACSQAMAQTPATQARVLSATPIVQQVGVPGQYCEDAQVYGNQGTTGTGAVIGAVIGGLAGHALGQGSRYGHRSHYYPSTRGPSTIVGAVAGGLIGNSIEGANTPSGYNTVRRCTTETVYENRTVGYDVTYEYAGQRYTTRTEQPPGAWLPVQVQPQGQYGSAHGTYVTDTRRFTGPSGVYQSAPAGVVVTQSITYSQPVPAVVLELAPPSKPPIHWHGGHRPPPAPHYWR